MLEKDRIGERPLNRTKKYISEYNYRSTQIIQWNGSKLSVILQDCSDWNAHFWLPSSNLIPPFLKLIRLHLVGRIAKHDEIEEIFCVSFRVKYIGFTSITLKYIVF